MADEEQEKKAPGKPWQPGQSGNPAGRPKGSKNSATLMQQELTEQLLSNKKLQGRAKKILDQALTMAENGDKQMLKFFLNKWLPDSGIAFGKDEGGSAQPTININISGTTDGPQDVEQPGIEINGDSEGKE